MRDSSVEYYEMSYIGKNTHKVKGYIKTAFYRIFIKTVPFLFCKFFIIFFIFSPTSRCKDEALLLVSDIVLRNNKASDMLYT